MDRSHCQYRLELGRNGIVIRIAKEVLLHLEIGSGFVVLFMIQLIQCYYYANLPVGIRNGLHVTGADPENVKGNSVWAGVDVRGQDIDFMSGECAANLFEKQVPIFGYDRQLCITLFGILEPLNSSFERSVGPPFSSIQILPDCTDVSAYTQSVTIAEVALGIQMLFDNIGIAFVQIPADFLLRFSSFSRNSAS